MTKTKKIKIRIGMPSINGDKEIFYGIRDRYNFNILTASLYFKMDFNDHWINYTVKVTEEELLTLKLSLSSSAEFRKI